MDTVVVLALVVLTSVFILSLLILVITCQRRRKSRRSKSKILIPFEKPPNRFSRNAVAVDSVDEIETMEHLGELLEELLDKNPWLYEARGIMQHVVAILTITKTITEKLSDVQLPTTPSPFHDAINMAMRNIYPRFDDLVESISAQPIDMRLLEARALSLGTVCWSLYLPYTLLDAQNKALIQTPLNEMNAHLVTIRTAAHLVAMADKGAEDKLDIVDLKDHLMRMRRQIRGDMLLEDEDDYETEDDLHNDIANMADHDDEEEEHHDPDGLVDKTILGSLHDHEKMPLVESEAIIDMIELRRVPEQLQKSNGVPDGNHKHTPIHHMHHHHHHHPHHMTNGSLNTVEEINEDDHHGEGTSTSCSSSSTSSASSTSAHPIDPKS
ncbi:hypothetical protein L5515_000880 [Caenorhabditis briggsae]|nr:hypothetical protein L3Y34_014805 [Caenorhabditis briggsae]ULU10809.1 hypothetical protein L3Y34_014805 [Caenorhabditis briggsae]UMM11752.1 hypothetical protein L5515_000880 [Caenorhabditis briggsae]UMM11753.1 hypothetical protein L5515_000880 [Caenorhabditis briggsae]